MARTPTPRRARLDSVVSCRRELARLYHEGREGTREVQDVSRLAHVVALIGRLIEGSELERRLDELEARLPDKRR